MAINTATELQIRFCFGRRPEGALQFQTFTLPRDKKNMSLTLLQPFELCVDCTGDVFER